MSATGAMRFFLPPELCSGPRLILTGSEAHHAHHVLRVAPGATVTVLNGAGRECLCTVEHASRDALELAVNQVRDHPPPACRITLLQALPKAKLIEDIIEKATELGAARIVPLLGERVVARLDPDDARRKAARWRQTAVAAIKQSGAPWLPEIEEPISPAAFVRCREPIDLQLVAALLPHSAHPRRYFDEFQAHNGRKPSTLAVWIGPEGDFTPEEYRLILESGARPISLGPLVLRVETAAICCLSIVNYELRA